MSQVLFLDAARLDDFESALARSLTGIFGRGERVCVKVHFGEPGNIHHLSRDLMRVAVSVLKGLGAEPFLFDSPVKYTSPRSTVEGYIESLRERGFTEETMGCPVVVSDRSERVRGEKMEYGLISEMMEADGVLVFSHVKGHLCTGFGAAIKNIGMGGMDKRTKGAIHSGGEPEYQGECTLCGDCADACPLDNVRMGEDRAYFDDNWCSGCSSCAMACTSGAIRPRTGLFDRALADGVRLALDRYGKAYFINTALNLTKLCDCVADSGPIVANDVGILFSEDIVAVERATHDLIVEASGRDVFQGLHNKSPAVHIREAANMGMGSEDYDLVKWE